MMTKRALHVCCIDHSNLELHLVGKILLIKVSIVTQNSLPESTIIVDPKNCICCTSWLVVIHWNPLNFMKIPSTILFQKNFRKSNVPFWQVKTIKIVCVLVLKKPFRLYAFMLSQQSLLSVKALCDLSTGNHQSIIGFQEGIFFVIEQILDSGGPEGNIKLMLNFLPTIRVQGSKLRGGDGFSKSLGGPPKFWVLLHFYVTISKFFPILTSLIQSSLSYQK